LSPHARFQVLVDDAGLTESSPYMMEVDFHVFKEDWSRFRLDDDTLLKVRLPVRKIFETIVPQGYPVFSVDTITVITTIALDSSKREPSKQPWNPKVDVPEDIGFTILEEAWQEYRTFDNFKVLVKPVLVKVYKYNRYNIYGEPIYNASIQAIINGEKIIRVTGA
jgi:hypothetical protein